MRSIICLGKKACDVGELYESRSVVVKLIDKDIEGENCFSIESAPSPEEYEKNTPDMKKFFSDIKKDVVFVLSGETEVANCSLKILQQIKNKNITIVYLGPQKDFLSNKQLMQERVIRGVLQEYTRSGIFKSMILLDSKLIENIMPATTIKEYDSDYNKTIVNLLDSYFNLESTEIILDNISKPKDVSRIMTLGYYDLSEDFERNAYELNLTDNKQYHFFLTEKTLESDARLLREIKEKIKNKNDVYTNASYAIRDTKSDKDFCFVVSYSKAVQI